MTLLPNFLVVGAAKCGTTTLFNILTSNKDVFIPEIKECRFFSQMPTHFKGGRAAMFQNGGVRDLNQYINLFMANISHKKGDISNDYFFYYESTILFIKQVYDSVNQPYPKIVIILRNPVERVLSMYNHIVRMNSTSLDFWSMFEQSEDLQKQGFTWQFNLKQVGMSFDPTKAYLQNFAEVIILLSSDLNSPSKLQSLQEFLELPSPLYPLPNYSNKNHYKIPRFKGLSSIISTIRLNNFSQYLLRPIKNSSLIRKYLSICSSLLPFGFNPFYTSFSINPSIRSELKNIYISDIEALSNLIQRDLSKWQ